MPDRMPKDVVCGVCGKTVPASEAMPARLVRDSVAEAIRRDHPDWSPESYVCLPDLNDYRMRRVRQLVEGELGAVTAVEMEVVKSLSLIHI